MAKFTFLYLNHEIALFKTVCVWKYIYFRERAGKKRVPLAIGFSFLFSSCVLLPSTGGGFEITVLSKQQPQ